MEERYGYGFIADPPPGRDEFYLRELQSAAMRERCGLAPARWRHLSPGETRALEANRSRCENWDDVWVSDPFDPSLVRDSFFAGRVRIGALEPRVLRYHDYTLPAGIVSSRVISCDIGDNAAIYDCAYLSHYLIGDNVILSAVNEMDVTNHAKFGAGIIKDGESEDVRVWIDPLNESGGRGVLPFPGMTCADAYLWTIYREDAALMRAFKNITQNAADSRRGFYGEVGRGSVIKYCRVIKDVRFGEAVYVKGANKLKNLTIQSDSESPSQIGEGVELVNGVIGYGCRVFYGCKAVRFVLGNNCSLKYGARLIHSILGDNSTVSCCEVLNTLVFPAHEQHHNNSFLIAALILGQSNMAAGATVGSNHNSRGPDGEIIAGRGFWPGLSSTLKHNCRFASFTLIARGSYPFEMHIPLPFSLLTVSGGGGRREVMPAYWWLFNMYALERNSWKFRQRDRRVHKTQHYETDYLAPDTVEEIVRAVSLMEQWGSAVPPMTAEKSRIPVRIIKPKDGLAAYRDMLLYYGVKTLLEYWDALSPPAAGAAGRFADFFAAFQARHAEAAAFSWVNLGGQLVPAAKADALRADIRRGRLASWEAIHAEYARLREEYPLDKAVNALQALRFLLGSGAPISAAQWQCLAAGACGIRQWIEAQVYRTKQKDYLNPFRSITYRSEAERDAVLGRLEDNPFIKQARADTARFLALASRASPIFSHFFHFSS
ncbi:MAG: DUF4954 family protein [Treponema sp.]|jgi:NDP-sugar pyrophosphorylase family protein/uncharacterized protein YbaA (DUF1428 family)|nr:DUF4954 family protein [Treponema sp.]